MRRRFACLIALLLCMGCGHAPDTQRVGLVRDLYDKRDYAAAEKVIIEDGSAFGDFHYFPYSVNLLVLRGLRDKKQEAFDQALAALAQMKRESVDYYYGMYEESIAHLRKHSLTPTFSILRGAECQQKLELLQDLNETASYGRFGIADVDAAYWYALYVNSICTTPDSRAIYISMLSNLDQAQARSQYLHLSRADGPFSAEVEQQRSALCSMRRLYGWYEVSGLRKLVDEGTLKCRTPYRGFKDERSPGPTPTD